MALLLGLTVWLAVDALAARTHLTAAADDVAQIQAAVVAGDDPIQFEAMTAELQEETSAARAATDGPHWWVAQRVPWLGASFAGVATVAQVVDDLAHHALPQLAQARASVDPAALAPVDGRIDLQPLVDVAPAVVAADDAVQDARARLGALDPAQMVGPVAGPVSELAAQVDEVAMTTSTASRAVQLIPPMLGADGPRTYAVLVQGNSELRSLGGMPGAVLLVTADGGEVRFESSTTAGRLKWPEPVLPLTAEETDLYREVIGRYMSDVTMTPDFPRTAELARALIERNTGVVVDGVLAVDPVLLQSVLGATGPVDVDGGPVLDGGNAAAYLLNGIYLQVRDESAQDAYFSAAARAVFGTLAAGGGEPPAVIDALVAPAREGRLLVWSSREGEESLLAGTVLGGRLATPQVGAPVVGVYLNSGAAAKIDYYLDYAVRLEQTSCTSDGGRAFDVTVDLTSTVPADFADWPVYVQGTGIQAPAGAIRTNVAVYAPVNGWIESARRAGEDVGFAPHAHDGLAVGVQTVDLAPGESTSITFAVVTENDQFEDVGLRITPGPHAVQAEVHDFPCAG